MNGTHVAGWTHDARQAQSAKRKVVTMDKKLFERLVESTQQHEEIRRGERAPSREFFVDAEKVKEIRAMTGLSQTKFARLLDVDCPI